MDPAVHVAERGAVGLSVWKHIIQASQESVQQHGKFTIALSGGSLPKVCHILLFCDAQIVGVGVQVFNESNVDCSAWHVFFSDERCVPLNDDSSNYKACKEALLDTVGRFIRSCLIV